MIADIAVFFREGFEPSIKIPKVTPITVGVSVSESARFIVISTYIPVAFE